MKILFIHTHYQHSGGEDTVFEQEFNLLSKVVSTHLLEFVNKSGWRGALQFLSSIYNVSASKSLKLFIHTYKPDIIHLHNWHFATGPIIIRTAHKMGIPIVLTIHNYRLLCPSATFLHKINLFTNSLKASFPFTAIRKKVYRNSSLQTFWLAFVVWFHKRIGTWNLVGRFILLTDFSRNLFINSSFGVSPVKFTVKPNFVIDPPKTIAVRGDSFLFIGRLSHEKGISTLLQAFRQTRLPLRIAGSGPLEDAVQRAVSEVPSIQYLGMLDEAAIQLELSESTALVFPSIWYEGMPMTILESFASATPVIASNLGAMATMIQPGQNGLHFEPGNATALAHALLYWKNLPEHEKAGFRQKARSTYEDYYTPEENQKQLLAIYQQVIYENKAS